MTSSNKPRAVVREIDGQVVLDDPDARAVMVAVNKANCRGTFELNTERVSYFKRRFTERQLTSADAVIVLLNVDDVHGGPLAGALMPGFDWQDIRDRGKIPFARGIARREGIQDILEKFDEAAADKLRDMDDIAVVVVDRGVAEIFPA